MQPNAFRFGRACRFQQDGKLRLDDPVSRFIPGLTRGNEVTVRQLLSHTSGYQDFWPQDYVMPMMLQATTPQAIADQWAKKPLDFDPGSRWQYSNTNYTLAGMVVEKASGMPFFQFVRTRILAPAGLTSAQDFDASPRAANTTGYIRYGLGPLRPAPDAGSGWMWAAGELAMTASDLAKWDINLIRHGLLKPESYRELPVLLASTLCKKAKARQHRHRVHLKTFILNLTDTSYGRMLAKLSRRMRSGLKNIRRSEWRSRDTAMNAVPTNTIWDWARSEHRRPGIISCR